MVSLERTIRDHGICTSHGEWEASGVSTSVDESFGLLGEASEEAEEGECTGGLPGFVNRPTPLALLCRHSPRYTRPSAAHLYAPRPDFSPSCHLEEEMNIREG